MWKINNFRIGALLTEIGWFHSYIHAASGFCVHSAKWLKPSRSQSMCPFYERSTISGSAFCLPNLNQYCWLQQFLKYDFVESTNQQSCRLQASIQLVLQASYSALQYRTLNPCVNFPVQERRIWLSCSRGILDSETSSKLGQTNRFRVFAEYCLSATYPHVLCCMYLSVPCCDRLVTGCIYLYPVASAM